MSFEILVVFGLLIVAIFLFSNENIPFDITALILLSVLLETRQTPWSTGPDSTNLPTLPKSALH